MNEFFIYVDDITVSPGYLRGWRIFKMTAVALGPKNLSRTEQINKVSAFSTVTFKNVCRVHTKRQVTIKM